jgi:hypothetical protein
MVRTYFSAGFKVTHGCHRSVIMIVRTSTMTHFANCSERGFVDRIMDLGSEYVSPDLPEFELRRQSKETINQARARGMETEFEVAAYAACAFAFGQEFEMRRDLPCGAIMNERKTEPHLKAAQLKMFLEQRLGSTGPVVVKQ